MSILDIITTYRAALLSGLEVTLELSAVIWVLGISTGTLVGVLGSRWKAIGVASRLISLVLTSVPLLALLFWAYYPLQALLNVTFSGLYTAIIVLSVLNAAVVADLVRGVLNDFPSQYIDAARVCGLTSAQILRRIQFPLVLRQLLPGILTAQIAMLQGTLFASLISVDELFRTAQRINSQIYQPVQVYSAVAVFYLLITIPISGLALWLRSRYTRDLSER